MVSSRDRVVDVAEERRDFSIEQYESGIFTCCSHIFWNLHLLSEHVTVVHPHKD